VGIGKVQFILSYTQYFALIAALGIPIYGVRIISQSSHDEKLLHKNLGELVTIHIICSLIVTGLYVATILSFSFFNSDKSLYFIAGSVVLLGFTSLDWYFSGIENFKLIAIRTVVVKLISLAALLLFVKNRSDYDLYLIISLIALIGNNVINIVSLRRYIKLSLGGIRKHLKPLMYTFGTTVATSMYTMLDIVLLGFFADDKAVGLYSASIKLTKVSLPFIISSATVLMPRVSKLFGTDDVESLNIVLNKSFSLISVTAVPIFAGLIILAPQLIYALSGKDFNDAVITMQILSPLVLIVGFGYFWGFQILIPAGKEKEVLISVILGMCFNLALNFILIPHYKQNGAAIANVISEIIVTSAYMFFCFKIEGIKISYKPLINNMLVSLQLILIAGFYKFFITNVYCQLILVTLTFASLYLFIQIKILKNSTVSELLTNHLMKRK
jgi:O-antigen/teichoic acid export membrane protein